MSVDLSRLHEITGGDRDTEVMLIDLFISDSGEILAKLKAAAGAEDVNGMREAAHSLKGSAANMGAEPLRALCAQLESLSKAGTVQDAPALLARIETEFVQVSDILKHSLDT